MGPPKFCRSFRPGVECMDGAGAEPLSERETRVLLHDLEEKVLEALRFIRGWTVCNICAGSCPSA